MAVRIPEEVLKIAEDIRTMRIRGAGRIARAAAKALKIAALNYQGRDLDEFLAYMDRVAELLLRTRPTAVSLPNAVYFVLHRMRQRSASLEEAKAATVAAADEFIKRSLEAVARIGEIGARRIEDGDVILTHCNSSAAIEIIKAAFRAGKRIRVIATETRPRFQGYITVRTLVEAGIPVKLIPDSAVRLFMKDIDKVVVGADTVAANGAVVNKIGTSLIALAAHEARVRVFVAAETYKFSPATVLGELVVIEERDPSEVVDPGYLKAHPRVKVRNPAFDVTPPEYIDLIVTERGIIPPQVAYLILKEEYGWALRDYQLHVLREEAEPDHTL